jgi:hypothetical protein
MNMNALPFGRFVLRTESPALAVNIAEFLQPYIGATYRRGMAAQPCHVVNQDYGLAGISAEAFATAPKHGILIPHTLISNQAAFTLLANTASDIETPTVKRRKYAEPTGNLHGDRFEPVPRSRVEL